MSMRHKLIEEILSAPSSSGRRASYRMVCELWEVGAMPKEDEKKTSRVIELMVRTMLMDKELLVVSWSSLTRDAFEEEEQES